MVRGEKTELLIWNLKFEIRLYFLANYVYFLPFSLVREAYFPKAGLRVPVRPLSVMSPVSHSSIHYPWTESGKIPFIPIGPRS
jgi:hypothetical protein